MEIEQTQDPVIEPTDDESSQTEPGMERKTIADRIDGFFSVYLKEQMLWPVLVALLAHVWVALSAVVLMIVRDQNVLAIFPMFILVIGSTAIIRHSHKRKHRVIPALVISAWAIAGVIAWIANRYDVY